MWLFYAVIAVESIYINCLGELFVITLKKLRDISALILSAVVISSCGSSNAGCDTNIVKHSSGMQIGNIGAIPTNKDALGSSYPLMVYNNSNTILYIDSISVSGLDPDINSGRNEK